MNFNNLSIALEEHILVVQMNRPKALNALNAETLVELDKLFDYIASEDDVWAVIITGSGDKAFVAGADINEFTLFPPEEGYALARRGQAVFEKIERCSKPVIAAVNGFALGGGCELAMACHMRLASENAQFGQPEAKLGLIPGYGGTQRLVRYIGQTKALELMLTCDMIPAAEALQLGLVNYVVTQAELMDKSKELLRKIFRNSPNAVAQTIAAVRESQYADDGYEVEAKFFANSFAHAEKLEGVAAFLEKRKANFR